MSKVLLITGATGKQGRATISALLNSPTGASEFRIFAATRDPSSDAAKELASRSTNIKLVQGDLTDVPGLFSAVPSRIHGVLCIQAVASPDEPPDVEINQAKGLIDAALILGVKHFIYSSVDRGRKSSDNSTNIPQWISKYHVERYLVEQTKGTNMQWTIVRPVTFMENLKLCRFRELWVLDCAPPNRLQLIAVDDVGWFVARAFEKPEEFRNRAVGLAGDELDVNEVNRIAEEKLGRRLLPKREDVEGKWGGLWKNMMVWNRDVKHEVDIAAVRREHPGLMGLGEWLMKKSGFAKA